MPLTPIGEAEFAALMAPLGPFGPVLAVGCSGGPDSLALTWLAHRWRPGQVLAMVADHGLRRESAAEAAGTIAQLRGHGIATRLLSLSLPGGARTQERARAARRTALLGACREEGALHLLLAHHLEDQRETLLMRALAGSGAWGLGGMASAQPTSEALVLRPLLELVRDRLRATCEAAGLVPVEDPSNRNRRFLRARLREAPSGLDPAPFSRRRSRMAREVAERLAVAVALLPEGCARLDFMALGNDAVAALALARLVQAVGGGAHPPAPSALRRLLNAREGSLGGTMLRRDGWLLREAPAPPVPAEAGALWDGRFRLGAAAPGLSLGALGADAARFRAARRDLPARALQALPALRDGEGRLVAAPHVQFSVQPSGSLHPLRFAPRSGPVTECFRPVQTPCQNALDFLCSRKPG
ncbi:tRNA lysidine(34) synthetase TilS [Sabulicella rubraurantiaca]|uniref:tRNA lysidine(34) synthetase TilS n=1 Tax=Sabulicella rubraurantiaca TaxID=2811429 RepID=UPI001A972403|nr:tRNA lysidine(34) synthetase TilS [Sabulicella rubraurantiaca]